jgi:hypothetical protein
MNYQRHRQAFTASTTRLCHWDATRFHHAVKSSVVNNGDVLVEAETEQLITVRGLLLSQQGVLSWQRVFRVRSLATRVCRRQPTRKRRNQMTLDVVPESCWRHKTLPQRREEVERQQ